MSEEGFLQRWSRRKTQGETAPPEEPRPPKAEAPKAVPATQSRPPESPPAEGASPDAASQQAEAPPPTLEDTQALTPESDFKPFMARDVAPEVRNAAMKKLFADPHFNVMDRMDVYIDDYSNPAPLPAATLRKMASAAFLKLVDDDEEGKKGPVQETPALTSVQDVAQSEHSLKEVPSPPGAAPDQGARTASQETDDDHADLRLQQDDAAGAEDPRRGTA
ncbi:DUF3306 domain-containing protein [Variovorax sp. OV329]|uniref:DUF3306 domain-containing protein n=1 Tax=Variovorax sp. OV329 TaxID=1882825 RepID=UPI0008F2F708|nr:DUF3306 domain-containing protein [Variovorax sp. OV329]SFM06312.1 Protein of unknown function [Variovorax sp. OV329]